LLARAMNPCPGGNWARPRRECTCTESERRRYIGRLSGPLLDRIDLHVHVPPVDVSALSASSRPAPGGELDSARERVLRARRAQTERHRRGLVSATSNARLTLSELRRVGRPSPEGERLLEAATERMGLSARTYVRILRVARTLADLDDSPAVHGVHVSEAVRCRLLDHARAASDA